MLDNAFHVFSNRALYPGLIKKSAILFYLLIKNHPFLNGNKRIAVMSLLLFLHNNGKWLQTTPEDLYGVARRISESKPEEMDRCLTALQSTIRKFLVDVNQSAQASN